jgi:hypothetical protein
MGRGVYISALKKRLRCNKEGRLSVIDVSPTFISVLPFTPLYPSQGCLHLFYLSGQRASKVQCHPLAPAEV